MKVNFRKDVGNPNQVDFYQLAKNPLKQSIYDINRIPVDSQKRDLFLSCCRFHFE